MRVGSGAVNAKRAIDNLVAELRPKLLAYARKRSPTTGADRREELVDDALLSLAEALSRGVTIVSPEAYARKVFQRKVADDVRKDARRKNPRTSKSRPHWPTRDACRKALREEASRRAAIRGWPARWLWLARNAADLFATETSAVRFAQAGEDLSRALRVFRSLASEAGTNINAGAFDLVDLAARFAVARGRRLTLRGWLVEQVLSPSGVFYDEPTPTATDLALLAILAGDFPKVRDDDVEGTDWRQMTIAHLIERMAKGMAKAAEDAGRFARPRAKKPKPQSR